MGRCRVRRWMCQHGLRSVWKGQLRAHDRRRKENCWDNAVLERFFLNLKMERVWQRDYANHVEAMRDSADYIPNFYNSLRLRSTRALHTGQLATRCLRAAIGNQSTYRLVQKHLTGTFSKFAQVGCV